MTERLNENYDSPKQKLYTLEREVTKDYKEFQRLSKDDNVVKGLTKVFDKCWNEVIKDEAEKIGNLDVWAEMKDILKNHPDLWLYVSWTLKLPLSNVKFSQLNTQQKINYLAFHDAFRYRRLKQLQGHKEPTNAENIINNCNANLKKYSARIDSKFSGTNLSNLLVLESTLKNDFWLTSIEAQQVKKYLKLIKDHPEYVSWPKLQEAGFKGIAIGISYIAVFLLWAAWMYMIDHLGDNPETRIYGWKTEISEPQEILKLLTSEASFVKSGFIEKEPYYIDENDNLLIQLGKGAFNMAQWKRVDMKLEWKLAIQYNLKEYSKMTIDHDSWVVELEVNQPDVVLTESHAVVMNKKQEILHNKSYDNDELQLEEQLKQQAVDDAKNDPNFYEEAKRKSEDQLFRLLKQLKPYWTEITEVKVKYVNKRVPDWERGRIIVDD